jgi:hypothetical protein
MKLESTGKEGSRISKKYGVIGKRHQSIGMISRGMGKT